MLVIFGANGRTGREVLREAKIRDIPVRAVAKNDLDTQFLQSFIDVNDIHFADADHKESLFPVLKGATAVVSCIDARTAGWGSPHYHKFAAANIVHAANEVGIKRILHLSVMGAYRWSPNKLNQQTFHLDLWIRRSSVPWTMLRVSCYHDEVIEGHVIPPDGGKPHPIVASSRCAPVSRRDVARSVMDIVPDLIPSRTWLIGGPEVFTGRSLQERIRKYIQPGNGTVTAYGPLPDGDVSVAPESSLIMVGAIPTETLEWALDPKQNPIEPQPFWKRDVPEYHPSDLQQELPQLSSMNRNLRYAVHKLLYEDLSRIGINPEGCTFDFSQSTIPDSAEHAIAHKASINSMNNIRVLDSSTNECLYASFDFVYDDLADDLQIWWKSDSESEIPDAIWERFDLGTKRRLHKHPRWKDSIRVRNFIARQHQS